MIAATNPTATPRREVQPMTRRLPGCAVDRNIREMAEIEAHRRGITLAAFIRQIVTDAVQMAGAR